MTRVVGYITSRLKGTAGRVAAVVIGLLHARPGTRRVAHLGTRYGGWPVCSDDVPAGAIAICVGAGEDVSFDVAANASLGMIVYCVDPTPRAIAHVRGLLSAYDGDRRYPINGGPGLYELHGFAPDRFRLVPCAVWREDGELQFFAPQDDLHVSYSAVDLQQTGRSITVPAKRLSTLLRELGEVTPHLIKLDIEGAEYAVVEDLIATGPYPVQLLVEFEDINQPRSLRSLLRVRDVVMALGRCGYHLLQCDRATFLFGRFPD